MSINNDVDINKIKKSPNIDTLTKIQNYILNFIQNNETQIKKKINDLHRRRQKEHSERLTQYRSNISKIKKQIDERQTSQQPCGQELQQNLQVYKNLLQSEINNENKINTTINVPTKFLSQTDCEKLDPSILYLECKSTSFNSLEYFDKAINCLKNITTNINDEIAKLQANEKKKIYIHIDNSHAAGVLIGKNKDGKSYLFIDRYNSEKKFLGSISKESLQKQNWFQNSNIDTKKKYDFDDNYFYEKINADVIIPTTEIQADADNCYLYSYMYLQILYANSKEIDNLIDRAFQEKTTTNNKIYDFKDIRLMPLPLQLLYQRTMKIIQERCSGSVAKNVETIHYNILQHMNSMTFVAHNISTDKSSNDKNIQEYNALLPFVGIIANIDINLFKEFVDGVIQIYNDPIQTTEKLNNNSYNQIKNNIDDHNINQFNDDKKEKETEDNVNEENKDEEKKEDLNNSKNINININDKYIIESKPQLSNDLDKSDDGKMEIKTTNMKKTEEIKQDTTKEINSKNDDNQNQNSQTNHNEIEIKLEDENEANKNNNGQKGLCSCKNNCDCGLSKLFDICHG